MVQYVLHSVCENNKTTATDILIQEHIIHTLSPLTCLAMREMERDTTLGGEDEQPERIIVHTQ